MIAGWTAARCVIIAYARTSIRTSPWADLKRDLPVIYGSPTMSPSCPDEVKYDVVDRIIANFNAKKDAGEKVAGVQLPRSNRQLACASPSADGAWGLIRASSRTRPILKIVVVEALSSTDDVRGHFRRHQGRAFEPSRIRQLRSGNLVRYRAAA